MKAIALWMLIFLFFQDIPYKPKEEFEIKLDYKFKQRPIATGNAVHLNETRREHERRTSSDMLPYLVLNVKLLQLTETETRMQIANNINARVYSKKIQPGSVVPIDLGFTADVKDRVTAHQYILTTISNKKNETSKIEIFIEEDGSFLVNGEKRGKF